MSGLKFAANPLLANSAPTADLQAASKGYVDSTSARRPTRAYTGVSGTVTLDNDIQLMQNFTVTGDITSVNPPASNANSKDMAPMQLRFLASGATRSITFNASIRLSTGISSRVFSVPSGELLMVAVEWSSLVSDYIITAATISAN